jgi:hypothetical protein
MTAAPTTIGALSGFGHNPHSARESMHLLHQAGHALKEWGEDLLGDDGDDEEDEESRR